MGEQSHVEAEPRAPEVSHGEGEGQHLLGAGPRAPVARSGEVGQRVGGAPGARAPEIDVPRFVNSLPRLVLKCGVPFGKFLHSILSDDPHHRDDGTLPDGPWPLPMPYPEAFRRGGCSNLWRKRKLCVQVAMLDWLYLGKPVRAPRTLKLGRKLSPGQWEIVHHLERLAEDVNSVLFVNAESMGRCASKAEAQDDEIGALHRALCGLEGAGGGLYKGGRKRLQTVFEGGSSFSFGRILGSLSGQSYVNAKPIVADRIKFGDPPAFDPLPFLDARTAAMYEEPQLFERELEGDVPHVAVRASKDERLKLFKMMAACGRLKMLQSSEVEPAFAAGLFAVPKDLEKDRLIMDCRPANMKELGLNHWCGCMANASLLGGIELGEDEDLLMSGQDIKDFFYQFVVSKRRCARNCLAVHLTAEELESIFPGAKAPSTGGFVGLSTMAMGDLCAVEFAQSAHLAVLLGCRGLFPHELLRLRAPVPRGLLSIGVVIDDLVLLEKTLKKNNKDCSSLSLAGERMDKIRQAYADVGLPTNPAKEFCDSASSKFWGAEVDGVAGIVRPSSTRFWPLFVITCRVCCLGLSTFSLLESLAGSWVSILMFRRRCLSAMGEVFEAAACGASSDSVLRLSPSLRDELLSCAILGSLCYINLRAKTLGTFRATDASDWGGAAVSALLPEAIAREAGRHSLSRSAWARLLPPGKAWLKQHGSLAPEDELPDDFCYDTRPLWELFSRALTFREEWRSPHTRKVHINLSELASHLREERRLCLRYKSFRCLYGLDSQVSLGCLVKGRSSSRGLNRLLQQSLAPMLGSDAYGLYGFLPSAINRADEPTRDKAVRGPDMSLPSWWIEAAEGDFGMFDEWLAEMTAHVSGAADVHDFSALGYKEPLSLSTAKRNRSQQWKLKKNMKGPASSSLPQPEVFDEPQFSFPAGSHGEEPACELCTEAVSILLTFSEEQVLWPRGSSRKFIRPGAIDMFSGVGGVARRLVDLGCPFVVGFEWKRSAEENLLWQTNQTKILRLIHLRAVEVVGSAMICQSFSRAVTPCMRSARFPRGVPWMSEAMKCKVSDGNAHSDFAADVISACEEEELIFWLENPDTSFVWEQRRFRKFRSPKSQHVLRVDYCRFGTPWRKRTRVATNCKALAGLRCFCTCSQSHVTLRGMHPTLRKPWTAVAEPYPAAFARLLGSALASEAGWTKRKFNIAGCCRANTLRVGEAKNPGPRVRRVPRRSSLEHLPLQMPGSIALGDRCWESFCQWVCAEVTSYDVLSLFLQVPLFLAHAVRRFGDLEFARGGSLLNYRHLVLAAQRRVPQLRTVVHICWDLASRWEVAEPIQHRVPMPLPVLKSIVSLSWQLGWKRWAGVTLICFFGIARVGEVLQCRRKHLLLPRDLLDEMADSAYLLLERSKTSNRQPARVQHLKITDKVVMQLLDRVFGSFCDDVFLFHGSPSVYRTRWNHILHTLGIDDNVRLTPGGLRGGGAVESYRRGCSVTELMWRMRVRNQTTLESYIQETAAATALSQLSPASLQAVRASASLFEHLR